MEPFLLIGALATAGILHILGRSLHRRKKAAIAQIAQTYGLAIIKGDRLEGELKGFAVSVTIRGHVTVRVDLKGLFGLNR